MPYIFRGRLCGYLCSDCQEPLANQTIRLYRLDRAPGDDPSPKRDFRVLSEEAQREKANRLLAEATMDEDGRFEVRLGDGQTYDGGPFELDGVVERVVGQDESPRDAEPVAFTLGVVQPEWEEQENDLVYVFRYCIPFRFWCALRALFDAWVICGRVRSAEDGSGVGGVTVEAFDADWLQDDALGSAVTSGSGHFRIDYSSADFRPTPFSPLINVELQSGPDVYFRVTTAGGADLLAESQSAGRATGRENIGPCFCIELRVPVPGTNDNPQFIWIGDFNIGADLDPTTGLTNKAKSGHGGPDFGFYNAPKLGGYVPKQRPGTSLPTFYRFLFQVGGGAETPITGGFVNTPSNPNDGLVIGSREVSWDTFGSGDPGAMAFQDIILRGSGTASGADTLPTPPATLPHGPVPPHILIPDAAGWVRVDQECHDGGFYGDLMWFNSNAAVPGGNAAEPGDTAGNGPSNPKNGAPVTLIFETATDPADTSTYERQTLEAHVLVNNWVEHRQLQLVKPTAGGGTTTDPCAPVSGSSVDAEYTVDHELLRSWSLRLSANNGWSPPPPSGPGPDGPTSADPRGDADTHTFALGPDAGGPAHCSHTVTLSTRLRLTNGETDDPGATSHDTFCT